MKIHGAGIIIFRNTGDKPEFLLLKPKWGQYRSLRNWSLPKGHIEKKESTKEAAIRETQEETGLKPEDIDIVADFETVVTYQLPNPTKKCPKGFKTVKLYLAKTKCSDIVLSREHTESSWKTVDQAAPRLPHEFGPVLIVANALVIKKYNDVFSSDKGVQNI